MSNFTLNFKEIDKSMVPKAGGKGASLGEMTQAKIPVPPGFVLVSQAFEQFLADTDLNLEVDAQLGKVNYQNIRSVDQASKIIRDLITRAPFPEEMAEEILVEFKKLDSQYVAVRSSATAEDSKIASWAGELETYLNTSEKNLLENIKHCWSSLFTSRAIFYACEKGLYATSKSRQAKGYKYSPIRCDISVAVVIQKMVESEVAGICFTVHPVTEDRNQMIIEAGWGLGEAVVSGQITPDAYVIDKRGYKILDINVSEQEKMIVRSSKKEMDNEFVQVPLDKKDKQKLSDKEIVQLAKDCHDIEKHYGFPVDIEWAMEKGKFYITQSRPITTL